MAGYSYKGVCYRVPKEIEAEFLRDYGREPDGDPGYDGDYWSMADMWIDQLQADLARVTAELDEANRRSMRAVAVGAEWERVASECSAGSVADVWYRWFRDKAIEAAKGGPHE